MQNQVVLLQYKIMCVEGKEKYVSSHNRSILFFYQHIDFLMSLELGLIIFLIVFIIKKNLVLSNHIENETNY